MEIILLPVLNHENSPDFARKAMKESLRQRPGRISLARLARCAIVGVLSLRPRIAFYRYRFPRYNTQENDHEKEVVV